MIKNVLFCSILFVVCIGRVHSVTCYFCSNCPQPFTPYSSAVTEVPSSTLYCAKKSLSSAYGAPASRGPAEPGLCLSRGCRWVYDASGRQYFTCCCMSNYCNKGNPASKSTAFVIISAFGLLAIRQYI